MSELNNKFLVWSNRREQDAFLRYTHHNMQNPHPKKSPNEEVFHRNEKGKVDLCNYPHPAPEHYYRNEDGDLQWERMWTTSNGEFGSFSPLEPRQLAPKTTKYREEVYGPPNYKPMSAEYSDFSQTAPLINQRPDSSEQFRAALQQQQQQPQQPSCPDCPSAPPSIHRHQNPAPTACCDACRDAPRRMSHDELLREVDFPGRAARMTAQEYARALNAARPLNACSCPRCARACSTRHCGSCVGNHV